MMVKPGFQGPFVARAIVIGDRDASVFGVDATMTDEGNGGRIMATASASFERVR
jgi:hypothetical protein